MGRGGAGTRGAPKKDRGKQSGKGRGRGGDANESEAPPPRFLGLLWSVVHPCLPEL